MALIEVSNVIKKYGNNFTAVDDISFTVNQGECVGILGPNGAGKTTTVRMLQCISPLTSGKMMINGLQAGLDERRIRAQLGVVPQENDLDNDLTVMQNLRIFAAFYDIPKKIARKKIEALLAFIEMTDKKNNLIKELSGGMKRRLLIARALINEPKIMILDEPTMGLDPQMRQVMWKSLNELKQKGMTMILTTHYMDEAEKMCDRLLIMNSGKIIAEGSPQELMALHGGDNLEAVFLKLSGRGLKDE
jgi:lipooligosaccharide transport system ATP-binding protein